MNKSTITIENLFHRTPRPEPWAEGDNIPWHDPEFSQRMLREHLSQNHDRASRRFEIIQQHIHWIHHHLLIKKPSRILDLGCGPGFYSHGLAQLGHTATGIDFSPASIDYARQNQPPATECRFHHSDIRTVPDFTFNEPPYDLVMMLYGEFNVFSPADARAIIAHVSLAIKPGGILLLEPQTWQAVYKTGNQPAFWCQAEQSVFSNDPHFWFEEYFWDDPSRTATTRYFVLDVQSHAITAFAQTFQAWTTEELDTLLKETGFHESCLYPTLANAVDDAGEDLMAFVVRKSR